MSVADNKSYKDMYHFSNSFFRNGVKDLPSVYKDNPEVNTSIKENTERANVEIEKDEVVLNPDLSALFKARGKKHSGGGINVNLRPNSFIFSDDKKLKITDEEKELFEFKKGGFTPADVLRKNVDMKHYNLLVSNLEDPKKDDLAKSSSALMLEKYTEKLGQIAFLQEKKKNFPQGIPSFSEGTLPIFDPQLKNDIVENKQYARFGGRVLPKAQDGGDFLDFLDWMLHYSTGNIQRGLLNAVTNKYLPRVRANTQKLPIPENKTYNSSLYNLLDPVRSLQRNKDSYSWAKEVPMDGNTNVSLPKKKPVINNSGNADHINSGVAQLQDNTDYGPVGPTMPDWWNKQPNTQVNPNPQPNSVEEGSTDGSIRADWEFTPYQKESQAYNLSKLLGINRYVPYRSRYNASYIDPALVNPEQAVGDLKGAAYQNIKASENLNPILRNAQNQDIYGQLLDKIPGVRSAYDNQNVGILNQSRQYNNQIKNQETMTNMGNDQNYYKESVIGRQNFDNMKNFLGDQYMNNRMRDVETNQSLAYNLLTQDNPAYNFDWKTGKFLRTKKSIMDVQSGKSNDLYTKILAGLDKLPDSDPQKWRGFIDIMKQQNIIPYLQSKQQ